MFCGMSEVEGRLGRSIYIMGDIDRVIGWVIRFFMWVEMSNSRDNSRVVGWSVGVGRWC